jgi:hypothetical protein
VKTTQGRPLLKVGAVALLAMLGLTACNSQPSAQRVADDLIKTLAETDEERVCMLKIIDAFDKDDLEQIGDDALSDDKAKRTAAETDLKSLQTDLEGCRSTSPSD